MLDNNNGNINMNTLFNNYTLLGRTLKKSLFTFFIMFLFCKNISLSMEVPQCICSDDTRLIQLADAIEQHYIPYITGTNLPEQLVNISHYLQDQAPTHCLEAIKRKFVALKAQHLAQTLFTQIQGQAPNIVTKILFDGSTSHYFQHTDGTKTLIRQLPATRDWTTLSFEKLLKEFSLRKGQQAYLFEQEAKSPGTDSVTSDSSEGTPILERFSLNP
jgi:hypothetical protein